VRGWRSDGNVHIPAWSPLVVPLTCGHCGRRGTVVRTIDCNTRVAHRCPGPFTLDAFVRIAR
jgi:hypothetical protein